MCNDLISLYNKNFKLINVKYYDLKNGEWECPNIINDKKEFSEIYYKNKALFGYQREMRIVLFEEHIPEDEESVTFVYNDILKMQYWLNIKYDNYKICVPIKETSPEKLSSIQNYLLKY